MSKRKEIKGFGFSNNTNNEGSRLVNKSGSVNVKRTGLSFTDQFSLFHSLINMNWPVFFIYQLGFYIGVNIVFSLLYVAFGIDGLSGDMPQTILGSFLKAFHFSSQTLTTVGYGAISPVKATHLWISSFEAFIGLMSFAMATGLLYGRFSRPRAKLLFSDNVLISPFTNGLNGLMLRIANKKDSLLINVEAKLFFSWIDEVDGRTKRKFSPLTLEYDKVNMLALSWTIVHPIDAESPLTEWDENALKKANAEVVIQIKGYDETYAQEIHARSSYKADEIIYGAKFDAHLGHAPTGEATLDFEKFSTFHHTDLN